MKKFILFAHIISTMGGGQIYTRNKINYMKKNNYDSYVVSANNGKVLIEDLKEYEKNVIYEFAINPRLLEQKQIDKAIEKLIKFVGKIDDETIIETNTIIMSLWGEIIAKKFGCINFVYIIVEKIPKLNKCMIDFFKYKRDRDELAGIKEETYKMIFNHYPNYDKYEYFLPLVCANVVDDYKNPIIDSIEYSEFNISTIGRLEKPYVQTLIKEIIKFASEHSYLSITYVMIGDTQDKKYKVNIKKSFKNIPNVKLYLTGNIYPIPKKFLEKIDVFISSAGSARVSAQLGKPTITIDARDYNSIGILNYDTVNTVFRKDEPKIAISKKLSYLFDDKKYKKMILPFDNNYLYEIDNVFSTHIDKYRSLKKDNKYFNFDNYKLSKKNKIKKIIIKCFNIKIYLYFQEIYYKIKRRMT